MFSFNDKKDPLINMAVSVAISGAIGLGVGLGIIALAPVIGVSVGGALGIGAVCLTTTVIGAGIGVGIGFALSDKNQDGTPHDSSSVVDGDRSQKTHTNFVEQSNGANTVAVTKGQQTSILPARIKEEPNASAVIQPENEQALTEKTKDLGNTLPSSSSAPAQGATNGGGGKGVAGSDSPQALQQTPQAQSAALEISARGEPIRSTNDGTLLSPQKYSAANKPLGSENSPTLQSSSPPSPSPAHSTNTAANKPSTLAPGSALSQGH